MLINELNTTLPNKKDEEFLKINFDSLFTYDFASAQVYEFDIMGLETIIDEENYESVLFDISRNINNKQKIITINKNIPEGERRFVPFRTKELGRMDPAEDATPRTGLDELE